jgi:uncharacterized protein YqkB
MAQLIASSYISTFVIKSVVELFFDDAMTPEIIEKYNTKTTGWKYIWNPNKG